LCGRYHHCYAGSNPAQSTIILHSDCYKEIAGEALEKLAKKLMSDPKFKEKFLKEAEKLNSGHLKGKGE